MKKSILTLAISSALLAGCSVSSYDSGKALEHWKNYAQSQLDTSGLGEKHALAVFYRTPDFQGDALNVYINSDYQASLTENSFTPVEVCAKGQLVSASFTHDTQFGNRTQGARYVLPVGQVAFFKATTDASGKPTFTRVEEDVARSEMANLTGKAAHTLSRTKLGDCGEVVLDNVVLSAGALWGLNKHSYNDMLTQGKQEIAAFANAAKNDERIAYVDVRGYTDPEGSVSYNLKLSQKRADTVRQALRDAGITQEIKAVGYGKTDLVVSDCAVRFKNKAERAECNLPNRRVEITTYSK